MKVTDSDKHTNLLLQIINYGRKEFYSTDPGSLLISTWPLYYKPFLALYALPSGTLGSQGLTQGYSTLSCLFTNIRIGWAVVIVGYKHRGARYLKAENLKVVWAEFLTLS